MRRSVSYLREFWLRPAARKFSCLLGLLLLFPSLGPAQAILDGFTMRHWAVEDGLPETIIVGIEQTPDGFLWCATPNHLVRFDGVQFVSIPDSQWPAHRPAEFRGLCLDRQQALWLYGSDGALCYRQGSWRLFPIERAPGPARPAAEIRPTPDGPMPVPDAPVIYLLNQTPEGDLLAASSFGVFRFDGARFTLVPLPKSGPAVPGIISAAAMDPEGVIWLAAGDQLLTFRRGMYAVAPLPPELGAKGIYQVFAGSRGTLWLQQLDGRHLARVQGNWREVRPSGLRVLSMLETAPGEIWIGAVEALYRWRNAAWDRLIGAGLDFPSDVRCLKADRDGLLWVGSGDGLYRLQPRSVRMFSTGLPSTQQAVTALLPRAEGGFWAGVPAAGLLAGSPGAFQPQAVDPMPLGTVTALARRRDGSLWIGTQGDHVWSLGAEGAVLETRQRDGMRSRSVTCLLEDRTGRLWVGTREGLLYEASPAGWLEPVAPQLDTVLSLCEDEDGVVWAGTQSSGLWKCRDGQVLRTLRQADGLSADVVRLLLADRDGVVWMGTPAGLGRWFGTNYTLFTVKHGLPDNDIQQMLDDSRGHLWLGSRQGITRVAKAELAEVAAGRRSSLRLRTLARDDGLTSELCGGGYGPLAARTPDGKAWFATEAGMACVDPEGLLPEPALEPPQMVELRAGNRLVRSFPPFSFWPSLGAPASLPAGPNTEKTPARMPALPVKALAPAPRRSSSLPAGDCAPLTQALPPGSRNLEFSFTTPTHVAAELVQFRTWLEGYETTWSEPRTARMARYVQVSPGKYRFHVMASSGNGVWVEGRTPLDLTLAPAFWETRTCRAAGAVLSLALAGIGSAAWMRSRAQHKLRSLERECARERAVADERARIARDMHDNIGAGLTEIAMQSAVVRRDLAGGASSEAQQGIERICHSASDLVRCVDEIVWAVNPGNDTVERFVNYVAQYAYHFLHAAGKRFRFDGPASAPPGSLPGALRHSLFLVVSEALNNAVKHAEAGLVQVEIRITGCKLKMVIADDGKGFDPAAATADGVHEGLANMRRRIESAGGAFALASRPGQGARLEIVVPLPPVPPAGSSGLEPVSVGQPFSRPVGSEAGFPARRPTETGS